MVRAGDGYAIHVTGLTHDERGYPVVDAQVSANAMVRRISRKIQMHVDQICEYEEDHDR